MRKVLPFFFGIFLVVVVGAYWVLNYTGSNKDLATGSPYLITVEPGMTTADIANLLHKQKLVKTPEAFRLEAKFRGLERDLQAGRYEITAGMSNSEIVEVLSKGQVQRVRFTVPEGFTVVKTAKKIEAEGLGSAEKFIEAARNYTPYPYMETSDPNVIYKAEGFIFPSTYMFDIGMNEKDMPVSGHDGQGIQYADEQRKYSGRSRKTENVDQRSGKYGCPGRDGSCF